MISYNIGGGTNQTSVAGAMAGSGKPILEVWQKSRRRKTLNLSVCADTSTNMREKTRDQLLKITHRRFHVLLSILNFIISPFNSWNNFLAEIFSQYTLNFVGL